MLFCYIQMPDNIYSYFDMGFLEMPDKLSSLDVMMSYSKTFEE